MSGPPDFVLTPISLSLGHMPHPGPARDRRSSLRAPTRRRTRDTPRSATAGARAATRRTRHSRCMPRRSVRIGSHCSQQWPPKTHWNVHSSFTLYRFQRHFFKMFYEQICEQCLDSHISPAHFLTHLWTIGTMQTPRARSTDCPTFARVSAPPFTDCPPIGAKLRWSDARRLVWRLGF
jgi:hypothetical protein